MAHQACRLLSDGERLVTSIGVEPCPLVLEFRCARIDRCGDHTSFDGSRVPAAPRALDAPSSANQPQPTDASGYRDCGSSGGRRASRVNSDAAFPLPA
jgi:hypothetical protein